MITRSHIYVTRANIEKVILTIILGFIIEIFLFNYQHFFCTNLNNRIIERSEIVFDGSYAVDENNDYILSGNQHTGFYIPQTDVVSNLKIKIYSKGGEAYLQSDDGEEKIKLDANGFGMCIYGYDMKNNSYYLFWDGVLYNARGEYIWINIPDRADVEYIYILPYSDMGYDIAVGTIEINSLPPIHFSFVRFFLSVLVILLFLYRREIRSCLSADMTYHFWVLITVGVTICVGALSLTNPIAQKANIGIDSYNEMADAFRNGRLNVFPELSNSLDMLVNPYDLEEREARGIEGVLDYVYYDGDYYVYYGVVPTLLFYLPYQIITGEKLLNVYVMCIFSMLYIASLCFLIYEIAIRYNYVISRGKYMFLLLLALFGSMILHLIALPFVYQIAQVSGLAFVLLGGTMYCKSANAKNKHRYIFLGSFLCSLAVACRPQYILFIIPFFIFIIPMFRKGDNRSQYAKALLVPYIVIGSMLMLYNYARFDNAFEFGNRFSITNDNIVSVSISYDKIFYGIKYMFTDPVKYKTTFPFIDCYIPDYNIDHQVKQSMGGFYGVNLLCIIGIFPLYINKRYASRQNGELIGLQYGLIIVSLIIGILDVVLCGCIERYIFDCAVFLSLSAVIVILQGDIFKMKLAIKCILGIGLIAIAYNNIIMMIYTDPIDMYFYNKELLYEIGRTIMFWR